MALNSRGSQFLYDAGDTAGLAALEEVNSIRGPQGSAAQIDTTHLGSSGKEYLADFPDLGEVTMNCNFTGGAQQMAMFNAFQASADPAPCRVQIPISVGATDYHKFDFLGIVTGWGPGVAVGNKATLDITVKVTGAVDYSVSA